MTRFGRSPPTEARPRFRTLHGKGYNFRHAPLYRHADSGYRPVYGRRRLYSDGYRRGYDRAYRKAFDEARREHRRYPHDYRDERWDRRPR